VRKWKLALGVRSLVLLESGGGHGNYDREGVGGRGNWKTEAGVGCVEGDGVGCVEGDGGRGKEDAKGGRGCGN
jgi:hypothetical protein